jgi:hypothetical protein
MKKLSSKTLPKILRTRFTRGLGGFRFDNGIVAFGQFEKKKDKEKEG